MKIQNDYIDACVFNAPWLLATRKAQSSTLGLSNTHREAEERVPENDFRQKREALTEEGTFPLDLLKRFTIFLCISNTVTFDICPTYIWYIRTDINSVFVNLKNKFYYFCFLLKMPWWSCQSVCQKGFDTDQDVHFCVSL